jgi:hypothetical protein
MPTDAGDTLFPFSLPSIGKKKITAAFDAGQISSDGGVLLLACADKRLGLIDALARPVQLDLRVDLSVRDVGSCADAGCPAPFGRGSQSTWLYVVRLAKLLVRCSSAAHACAMFCVDEATTAAIRQAAFETSGELSAVGRAQAAFPGDREQRKRQDLRAAIAGWKPLPPMPPKRTRTCRTRSSTT